MYVASFHKRQFQFIAVPELSLKTCILKHSISYLENQFIFLIIELSVNCINAEKRAKRRRTA